MTLGDLYPRLHDRPAFAHLAAAAADSKGRPLRKGDRPWLTVRGIADSSTGYGQMTARLIDGLEANGIPVGFESIATDAARRPVEGALSTRSGRPKGRGPVLMMAGPWTSSPIGSIILTMWEATLLQEGAVRNLNRYRAVVVPCEANLRWFRDSGVVVPIRIVPLGIDPTVHNLAGRPAPTPGVFRVGAAGRVGRWPGNRKGLANVAAAFLEAFPGKHEAVLEVKTYRDCDVRLPSHPRIRLVQDALTDEGLADWYRSLDLFVSASKGEGWGLQPHQAMACGTPVAAPWWGGHAHYMTPESSWPVEWDERIAGNPYYTGSARWCIARHASLVARMREAYADADLRRSKGEAAAIRAAEFTWERSARELAEVVREFGLDPCRAEEPAPPDPTRRFDRDKYRSLRLLVLGCEYRGPFSLECGCGGTRICLAGKGRPIPGSNLTDVTERDCLACAGGD